MTEFSDSINVRLGHGMEQDFAAQVISGRRRIEGATRGLVFLAGPALRQYAGGLTWDMHGITIDSDVLLWVPYSNIDHIVIEAGS